MKSKTFIHLAGFILICILAIQPSLSQGIRGNEKVTKTKRQVSGIESVRVRSGIDLIITQGNEESLEIEADENLQEAIITEMQGSTLHIYVDRAIWRSRIMKAHLSVKTLNEISASGGSDVETNGKLEAQTLYVECSGGSDLSMDVTVKELKCKTSGGSDAYLTGVADVFNVTTSGGSDLNAYDLKASSCYLEASGGSDAEVYATDELTVKGSGGSDVYYMGDARVDANMSGSSDLHHR